MDPERCTRCQPGEIGELWVRGPSVAQGYWQRTEQTEATFRARLAGDSEGGFLRTGDLGYVDGTGEVFVTGRLKDLIIIAGRNFYPQDIELTVEKSHPSLSAGTAAAFSVDAGRQERLAVVVAVQRQFRRNLAVDEVFASIRRSVAEEHDLQVFGIALLQPSGVPKTSSGKIQRRLSREMYLQGAFSTVGWQAPITADTECGRQGDERLDKETRRRGDKDKRRDTADKETRRQGDERLDTETRRQGDKEKGRDTADTEQRQTAAARVTANSIMGPSGSDGDQTRITEAELARWLRQEVARRCGLALAQVDPTQPFSSFGFGSLEAVSLAGALEAWLGETVPATLVYDQPSIAAVGRWWASREATTAEAAGKPSLAAPDEPIAIIGLGCRFPGAGNPTQFWDALKGGRDCIQRPPAGRFSAAALAQDARLAWGGFLDHVDQFDPEFFGLAPREAAHMDPQQRLLLEVAWETLEDAGCDPRRLAGSETGVFVGISGSDYLRLLSAQAREVDAYVGTGNAGASPRTVCPTFLTCAGPASQRIRRVRLRWWLCTWRAEACDLVSARRRWRVG